MQITYGQFVEDAYLNKYGYEHRLKAIYPPNLTSCVQFLPSKQSSDKPTKCSALIHTVYYWDGKNHKLLKIFCPEDTTTYLPIAMDHLIHNKHNKG